MAGIGPVESIVLLCLCGLAVLGVSAVGLIAWLLTSERRGIPRHDHGELDGLGDDDHPHYLTDQRAVALFGGADHVHSLADLQDVQASAPLQGQVLLRARDFWQAQDLPARGSTSLMRVLVTVRREAPRLYEFWFTPDAPGNQTEIIDLPPAALQVFRETGNGPKYLTRIPVENIERVSRNVFRTSLRQESEFLRFTIDLMNLPLANSRNLRAHALENGLSFLGQGGDHTVTVHYRLS